MSVLKILSQAPVVSAEEKNKTKIMNTKTTNSLNMLQTTQLCLETNKTLFKDIPAFAKASGELDAIVTGILGAQRQQASKEGLAEAKGAVRIELAEAAHEIAALTHACASANGKNTIAKRTDLSLSDVQAGTEAQFIDRCKGILADADEISDESDDFGVTTAKLKNVKDLLAEFEDLKPQPRAGAAIGRSATRRIETLNGRASDLLRGRIDRLMVQFKKTQPAFFESYQAGRKIVRQSAGRTPRSAVTVITPVAKAA